MAAPLLGYWHGALLYTAVKGRQATLEIEANISTGTQVQVFLNSNWSEPHATAISPGLWTVYRFPADTSMVNMRFDPSDRTGAVCLLKAIRLCSGDGEVRSLPLVALQSWGRAQLEIDPPGPDGVVRIATLKGGGYAMGEAKVNVGEPTLPFLASLRLDGPGFLTALICFGTILVLSVQAWPSWRPVWVAGTMALAVGITYFSASRLQTILHALPSTSDAVGYAAFHAYPKPAQEEDIAIALIVGLTMAIVGAWWVFGRRPAGQSDLQPPRWASGDWVFLSASVLLFALATVPPASSLYQAVVHIKQSADFDSQNVLFWNYAAAHGKLPFRDFWFPYGGTYLEGIPLSPYIAYAWLEKLVTFCVVAFSLYVCLRRSRLAAVSIWAALFLMETANLFWVYAIWRYMLSASVILFAVAALQERRRWLAAAAGLWAAHVISEELSQAIFALPGVAVLYGSILWRHRKRATSYASLILTSVAAGTVGMILYILFLVARGQFRGWLAFVLELPSSSAYSAWPLDFPAWLSFPSNVQQLYLLTVILLLAGGGIQAVASRFESPILLCPLAIGLACAMQLEKEIVRPGMSTQILPISALGLGLLAAQQVILARRPKRAIVTVGYCGAALLSAFFLSDPPARAELGRNLDVFAGKGENLDYMLGHRGEWQQAKNRYFAPDAFEYGGTPGPVFRDQLLNAMGDARGSEIYVLGDRPDIYMLLDKPAPYYVSIYNQSPKNAQETTVTWLRRHNPAFVVWDAGATEFDQIPNVVRIPLVYRYVVSHYVPAAELRGFQLLRLRRAGEPPDIVYWRRMLGDLEPLGDIPSLSSAAADANSSGPIRDRYLLAQVVKPEAGRSRAVGLSISGESIRVQFAERAGVSTYWINLERLPWMDLEAGMPTLLPQQESGMALQLKMLRFASEPLY